MELHRDVAILVVESAKALNRRLCEYLWKSGRASFSLFSALNLSEARAILDNERVDFVVLDLELPDGTGEELMGYLVSTELYEATKVIVLTGVMERIRRDRLFQLGIIDYIFRDNPINFLANEIRKGIAEFIARREIRILVVNETSVVTDHVATVLRNQNYTVETCERSTEVYERLKARPANLLITGLLMEGLDGIELLRKIRKDDALLDLPVIGVSETTHQELVSRLLKSGANDFLARPFLIENLLLKVDVAVSLFKKQRKLNELNAYLKDEISRKVEEIRSKDQLLELENRHAQMGVMLGALTHQWKQPLHAITAAAEYIGHIALSDEERKRMVGTIRQQVLFLSETMESFRHFFKPIAVMERFAPLGACENVIGLLGESYGTMQIRLSGEAGLCVMGYPNEFHQVIVNLLNNAQDAFKKGDVEEPQVTIRVAKREGMVVVSLCDNAGGIADAIIDTLFDQYVSTKGKEGTGIGLHMSRSIIQKIGGTISVCNDGEGACFTITLPLVFEEAAALSKELRETITGDEGGAS